MYTLTRRNIHVQKIKKISTNVDLNSKFNLKIAIPLTSILLCFFVDTRLIRIYTVNSENNRSKTPKRHFQRNVTGSANK